MTVAQQASQTFFKTEWTRTTLSQLSNVVRGASPRPAGDPRYFNGDFIPWLTVAALTNIPDSQPTVLETAGKLTEAGAQFSRTLAPGTVIIANSGATLGVAKILGMRCCANDGIAALLDLHPNVDARYVVHQINSQTDRLRKVVATGNGQPNLNTGLIGAIEIDLPGAAEQSAIAAALGDADALIDSLEQLLTKKREIKQGAMYELLTGKRRLPGFSREWHHKRLGDLLSIRHGRSQKQVECNDGDYPILATGGQIGWANAYLSDRPSVLIGRKGTIDQPRYMDTPFWSVDTLFYSEVFSPNVAKFLYYRFCLIDWMRHNEASGVPSLGAKVIESIEVSCPDWDEQLEIADTLSDMDTDIFTLEARLTKARALKQGMVHALLTGRIRLVEPNA